MKGFVKITCGKEGFETHVDLADVSIMDKAHLLSAMADGLDIDGFEWAAIKSMIDMDVFDPKVSRRKGSIKDMLRKILGEDGPDVLMETEDVDPIKRAKMMGLDVDEMPMGAAIGGSPEQLMEFLQGLMGGKK